MKHRLWRRLNKAFYRNIQVYKIKDKSKRDEYTLYYYNHVYWRYNGWESLMKGISDLKYKDFETEIEKMRQKKVPMDFKFWYV